MGEDSMNKKRSSKLQGCTCKKGCKTKACSCKKAAVWCVALCKCNRHACANREVPGTDVSSSVETDKESEELDDTDQLLDSTYDVNKIPKLCSVTHEVYLQHPHHWQKFWSRPVCSRQ